MSAASCLLPDEQFQCSICLDVFTDPVSTPCGHNFCKTCITQHWNINIHRICPLCREVVFTMPEMKVNTLISKMAAEFRQSKTKASSRSEQPAAKPEVQCDVCTGTKLKAIKSCLMCEASYCPAHLEPHLTTACLESHKLIHPVDNLEYRMCTQHNKTLKLFCKTDQMCLCMLCAVFDHKNHECVPLKEFVGKKADWTQVRVHQRSYERSVGRAVAQLDERIQQFAVDVTLDPDTAHPNLILSDDEKQVHYADMRKSLPDNPQRFDRCVCVLGRQGFSSGRFYFEVQVKGKTAWDLGVVTQSINRKGNITPNPWKGYWAFMLRNENEYNALAETPVILSVKPKPEKVGVFVDYVEGLVSFYDVDAATLIFSFTGCFFTHKLLPFFSPSPNYDGKNSAPLIISAVNHTE